MVEEICYDREGNKYAYYEYNSSGSLLRLISYGENNQVQWEEIYEYDSGNNLIKQTDINENGEVSSVWEYMYDENDNLIKQTLFDENGNAQRWHEWEYDKNNNLIKRIYGMEPNGEYSYQYECSYDAKGNRVRVEGDNYEGETWVIEAEYSQITVDNENLYNILLYYAEDGYINNVEED